MMTREEAHAMAEREVLEYARLGKLREVAKRKGKTELEYALGTLLGACSSLDRDIRSGRLTSGDIESLAALAIELLREMHLQHYNAEGAGAVS